MNNYTLVNVVAGGDFGVEVNLHEAVDYLSEFHPSYEPEVGPGLHFELPDTGVTVMIFRTGKYHLTGGESTHQIRESYEELRTILETNLGISIAEEDPDIRNLVYQGDFGQEIDIEAIRTALSGDTEYDPSNSPGLKYRMDDFPGLFTLYRTGSYIYTGNSDEAIAARSLDAFNDEIEEILT